MKDGVDSPCACGMHEALREAVRVELRRLLELRVEAWYAHVLDRAHALGGVLPPPEDLGTRTCT